MSIYVKYLEYMTIKEEDETSRKGLLESGGDKISIYYSLYELNRNTTLSSLYICCVDLVNTT